MGLFDLLKKPQKSKEKERMVYISPRGKTYHVSCGCFGSNTDEYSEVPEFAAVKAGFVRCKKCDWYEFDREAHRGKK